MNWLKWQCRLCKFVTDRAVRTVGLNPKTMVPLVETCHHCNARMTARLTVKQIHELARTQQVVDPGASEDDE